MKPFFLTIFTTIFIISCTQEKKNIDTSVVISGKITNPKEKQVFIEGVYENAFSDTLPVAEDGTFHKHFDSLPQGYYHLLHGGEYTPIYLTAGDSIYISFDTKEFDETMRYSGKGAEKNNFLAKVLLLQEEITKTGSKEIYSLNKEKFITKTDSIRKLLEHSLQQLLDSVKTLPDNFVKYEKAKILYWWAEWRNSYPFMHKYLTGNDSLNLGEDYNSYLKELNINDSTLIDLPEYQNFLRNYLQLKVSDAYKNDSILKKYKNPYTVIRYKLAKELFPTRIISQYLMYDILRYNETKDREMDSLVDDFKKYCTNKKYVKEIEEDYKKWDMLAEGKPAPGFKYVSINGDSVALSDLKGKYVYIDVWATWCGPCRMEIPHLEKFQKEYKGKNIVFVSISVDDNKEAWKKMVTEKKMKGIQLHSDGGWNSEITQKYNIKGIPRFILIDPAGNIISANAPRPSSPALKELLKKYRI